MVEKEVVVAAEEGLHARPATRFVQEAKRYESEIRVFKEEAEANAKSSLSLMTLGAKKGDRIRVVAEGEDEAAAADALIQLIEEG